MNMAISERFSIDRRDGIICFEERLYAAITFGERKEDRARERGE